MLLRSAGILFLFVFLSGCGSHEVYITGKEKNTKSAVVPVNRAMVTEAVLPVLPSEKTVSESGTGSYTVSQQSADGRIDINTADRDALMTLKGIGEKKALAVIAYRVEHGGFESTEELMKVKGIGEKTFAGLKDKVTVGR